MLPRGQPQPPISWPQGEARPLRRRDIKWSSSAPDVTARQRHVLNVKPVHQTTRASSFHRRLLVPACCAARHGGKRGDCQRESRNKSCAAKPLLSSPSSPVTSAAAIQCHRHTINVSFFLPCIEILKTTKKKKKIISVRYQAQNAACNTRRREKGSGETGKQGKKDQQ